MSDETYTLREAQAELRRRECAADYHEPYNRYMTMCDPVGHYVCKCGAVTWKPEGER